MIRVSCYKRLMADGSFKMGIRWVDPETGREVRRLTGIHTKPSPGRRKIRAAFDVCRVRARAHSDILNREAVKDARIEPLLIRQAADQFLAWCRQSGPDGVDYCAPGTIANKDRHVDDLAAFIRSARGDPPGGLCLHHVSRYDFARWRDSLIGRGLAATTINVMLASASSWLAWAIDYGHATVNPLVGLQRVRTENGRAQSPLADPEKMREELTARLQDIATDRFRHVAMFLACTGLRQGEFKGLRRRHVDVDKAVLSVPRGRETTKKHERAIPMCRQVVGAAVALLEFSGAGPDGWFVPSARDPMRALTSQLGRALEPAGITPHDLRRFFQTALETIGAPVNVVDDLVGHSPGKVRAAYTPGSNLPAARPWVMKFEKWMGEGE